MRRLIRRIEKSMVGAHEFLCNTWYYLGRGHSFGQAISMARDTLPR